MAPLKAMKGSSQRKKTRYSRGTSDGLGAMVAAAQLESCSVGLELESEQSLFSSVFEV
jgi:hypothetical protein